MMLRRYLFMLALCLPLLTFAQNKVQYVVKQGDTMASIAAAHGVTEQELRQANGENADMLFAGLVLEIPSSSKASVSSATGTAPTPARAHVVTGAGAAAGKDCVMMNDSSYVVCSVVSVTTENVTIRQDGTVIPMKLPCQDVAYISYADGTVRKMEKSVVKPKKRRRR